VQRSHYSTGERRHGMVGGDQHVLDVVSWMLSISASTDSYRFQAGGSLAFTKRRRRWTIASTHRTCKRWRATSDPSVSRPTNQALKGQDGQDDDVDSTPLGSDVERDVSMQSFALGVPCSVARASTSSTTLPPPNHSPDDRTTPELNKHMENLRFRLTVFRPSLRAEPAKARRLSG
jgi:hypothetical protein